MAGYTNIPYEIGAFEAAESMVLQEDSISGRLHFHFLFRQLRVQLSFQWLDLWNTSIWSMLWQVAVWYCYRADGNLYVQRIIQEL